MKLLWTAEAISKLNEIEEFISNDNPLSAAKFVDKLVSIAESLIKNHERGRVVPELALENIREILHKNYRIVYLIKRKTIYILTVFEGHKLLDKSEIQKRIS